jgi:hypothetical protein
MGLAVKIGVVFEEKKLEELMLVLHEIYFSTNQDCLLIVQLIRLAAIYLQTEYAIFH